MPSEGINPRRGDHGGEDRAAERRRPDIAGTTGADPISVAVAGVEAILHDAASDDAREMRSDLFVFGA